MEIVFKEGEWYKEIPKINEDVFISYDLKITKNNFKYLYEKTIEIARMMDHTFITVQTAAPRVLEYKIRSIKQN